MGSTLLLGAVTAILAGTIPLDALADLVSIGTLAAFSAVSLAVVALRVQEPSLERKFRAPGSPWLPIIGIAINLWLMSALSQAVWIRFGIWIVLGLVIYFLWGMRSAGNVFDANREVYLKHFVPHGAWWAGLVKLKYRVAFGIWKAVALLRAKQTGHRKVRPV